MVHFQQKLLGMDRIYIRQASKLNPQHSLALKYAPGLKIQPDENTNPQSMAKAVTIAALVGFNTVSILKSSVEISITNRTKTVALSLNSSPRLK